MTIPLIILSFGAAGIGLALGHVSGIFDGYLGHTISGAGAHHEMDWLVAIVSTVVAVAGIGLAWIMYGNASSLPSMLASACPPLTRLSLNKFYLDEIYSILFVLPLRILAHTSYLVDRGVIDGLGVGLFTHLPREVGRLLRPLQNGLVQFYALSMMLAMAVMLAAILAW